MAKKNQTRLSSFSEEKQPKNTGNQFKPGMSGNPGGRLKGQTDLARLARTHTDLAVNTLAEICANKAENASARVTAANYLLDRGYGKAPVEVTVNGNVESMTEMQLLEIAALALEDDADTDLPVH